MRLSVFVGVLAVASGIAMGKVLHDREVASAPAPEPAKSSAPDAAPTPRPSPLARRSPAPASTKPAPLTADEQKLLDEPRRALAGGRFEEARLGALAIAADASPSLRAALQALSERATLYSVLTRGIRRHPFANASDLVEITLASGVTHTARVLRESDDTLTLSLADGREIEVHQERVVKRTPVPAETWRAQKRAELEKAKAGLEDAGSLEVFRAAFEAFESGFADLGVPLLERALSLPGGGAVVDVYGAGDLELLHRAQERLRSDLGRPSGGASELALARRTRPRPQPSPAPPDVPAPSRSPEAAAASPSPAPASPEPAGASGPDTGTAETPERPSDLDRLFADEHWKQAQAIYSKAVAIYRDSFAGNTAQEKAGIREAVKLLEQAHGFLDQLPQDMGDANGTIDDLLAKVNSLLLDAKKRKLATGS